MIKGEPPQARRRGERWWQVAEACQESPGVWAEVPDCAPGVLHAIRAKRYQAFREGDWEVKERPEGDTGRMTIYLTNLRLLKGSDYDIELEEGDTLTVPRKNNVVTVMGAVMMQGSYIYSDRMSYQDYINDAGGYSRYADEGKTFVLKVDGTARKLASGLLNWSPSRERWELAAFGEEYKTIEPGDTIVVPESVERIAWLREVRDITQILMNTEIGRAHV